MARTLSTKLVLIVCATVSLANAQSPAEFEFRAGLEAKANAKYTAAIEHFQRAVSLDPAMITAHREIGEIALTDCGQISEADDMCVLAVEEYRKLLTLDAFNVMASTRLAYALYLRDSLDEAENQYRQALSLAPDDADAMCGLARVDLDKSWRDEVKTKVDLGLSLKQSFIGMPACVDARNRNLPRIDEGTSFATALTRRYPADANFAGFLGLLYNERADVECGDSHAFSIDKKASAEWYRTGKRMSRKTAEGPHDDANLRCPPAPPLPQ